MSGDTARNGPSPFEDITYRKHERVEGAAWITIDRPQIRNAARTRTYEEIAEAFADANDDAAIGVIVVTGAGDKAFCAGGDIKAQSTRTPEKARRHFRALQELRLAMRQGGKPSICRANGDVVGSGHELHLFCDLTIAASHARFGQVGPKVGSAPVWGGTQILPLIVGEKRAREMIFLCRLYSAEQALAMGLVNAVVPFEALDAEVDRWCDEILDKSPQSIRLARLVLNHATDQLNSSFQMGGELLSQIVGNEENLEGINAFMEKRKPDFKRFRTKS